MRREQNWKHLRTMNFVNDRINMYVFIININQDFRYNWYFDKYYMAILIKVYAKAFDKITINPFINNNVLTILITIYLCWK